MSEAMMRLALVNLIETAKKAQRYVEGDNEVDAETLSDELELRIMRAEREV